MKSTNPKQLITENLRSYSQAELDLLDSLRHIGVFTDTRINGRRIDAILTRHPEVRIDLHNMTHMLPASTPNRVRVTSVMQQVYTVPQCRGCPATVRFNKSAGVWNRYCSKRCANNSPIHHRDITLAFQAKYGVNRPLQLDVFKQKVSDTKTCGDLSRTEESPYRDRRDHAVDILTSDAFDWVSAVSTAAPHELEESHLRQLCADHGIAGMCERLGISATTFYKRMSSTPRGTKWNAPSSCSTVELDVAQFVENELGVNIVRQHRVGQGRHTIDIFVPSHNLAIEVDGVYWHSEGAGRGRTYHTLKRSLAPQYRWISVTDTEWLTKQDIVKSRLRNVLGCSHRVHARRLDVTPLDRSTAESFFNTTHLQSSCVHKHAFGLVDDEGEVYAAMSFGTPRYTKNVEWELLRYSSKVNTTVVGGASRLFTHFRRTLNPETVISYCDLRTGSGRLYDQLGFTLDGISQPNYWYFDRTKSAPHKLYHRSRFQKHKLEKLLRDFNPSNTEWENMQQNGWDRVWDVGSARYLWQQKKGA